MSTTIKLSLIKKELEATLGTYRLLQEKAPSDYAKGLIEGIEHSLNLLKIVMDEGSGEPNRPKSEG